MKNLVLIICLSLLVYSCAPKRSIIDPKTNTSAIKPEKNEDGEWDLDVMDSQWDYFLHGIAKPINFYSEEYLKSKNSFLVSEWNSYYYSGRYRNVIESSIEYDPRENYGKKFEWKLYQVFAFVQWKYGLRMNGLSGSEIR